MCIGVGIHWANIKTRIGLVLANLPIRERFGNVCAKNQVIPNNYGMLHL